MPRKKTKKTVRRPKNKKSANASTHDFSTVLGARKEIVFTPVRTLTATPPVSAEKYRQWQTLVLYLIFLQALIAMLGSLYFSNFGDPVVNLFNRQFFTAGHGFSPCLLCWYARILTYPMVLISTVGLLKDDRRFSDYILPAAVIGIFLEIYHYSLQKFHIFTPFGCTLTNPCDALQVQYVGFITIPFLALLAFLFITFLCVMNIWLHRKIRSAQQIGK